ncbi:WD40-repeat-containing domain protein [Scheffersomyces amazonensis]|uniref:WD40-repeat-containing domain protein n=1 Tax=Scheffersomyces amazonensis TaxID=1078765 RepID=UPI00315D4655
MKYWKFEAHTNSSINSCVPFKDNYILTGGGNDFSLKLFDLKAIGNNPENYSGLEFPKVHSNSINAIDISSTYDFVASASNNSIIIQDVMSQTKLYQVKNLSTSALDTKIDGPIQSSSNNDEVLDCKILNDSLISTCGVNHRLNLFDLRQRNQYYPVYSLNLGDDNLNCIAVNDNYHLLSVGSSNGILFTIDFRNSNLIQDTHDTAIINIAKYEDDHNLISFNNGTVELFDGVHCKSVTSYNRNNGDPYNLSYKLNSQYITSTNRFVSGTDYGIINIFKFNAKTGETRIERELSIETTITSKTKIKTNNDKSDTNSSKILSYINYTESTNQLISTSGNGFIHVWDYVF